MISDAYLVTKLINNLQKTPICPPFFKCKFRHFKRRLVCIVNKPCLQAKEALFTGKRSLIYTPNKTSLKKERNRAQ